ncbi:nuclear transport factor 2 family protein [Gordonia rubripertincta]|nr:nuclear transport factor 2 family protein [Gordonia rubripertincta]
MMGTPESTITALLTTYVQRLDDGDLTGVAELFDRAEVFVSGSRIGAGSAFVERLLHDTVIIYEDGTPHTRHVLGKPSIEIEDQGRATVSCEYTVTQDGPDGEYVVMVGRHHDTFIVDDGEWHFASRDYGDITHVGDTSRHLRS